MTSDRWNAVSQEFVCNCKWVLQPLSQLDLRKTRLVLGIEVGASQSVEADADPKVVGFNVTNTILDIINFTTLILKCVFYALWWWFDRLMLMHLVISDWWSLSKY